MEDKIIMNTVLTLSKNACDILFHGSIESSTPKIKKTFIEGLDKFLSSQGEIFKEMENAGLYNLENVPVTKIKKAYSKHECEN